MAALERLFTHLNARLFLRFREETSKKRTIVHIAGGIMTFGTAPSPIPLYEGPTGRRAICRPAELTPPARILA